MLFLFSLFIIKHFICDFPLQRPQHYLNKGKYGHWGGIEHALIHGFFTVCITLWIDPTLWFLGLIDAFVHYHIDWFKMWWGAKKGYTPQDSMFWIWLGLDQMLHYLTYVFIIGLIIKWG